MEDVQGTTQTLQERRLRRRSTPPKDDARLRAVEVSGETQTTRAQSVDTPFRRQRDTTLDPERTDSHTTPNRV